MKRTLLVTALFVFSVSPSVARAGDVWVNGYLSNDGRYVKGHYRSSTEGYKWSTARPGKSEADRVESVSEERSEDGPPAELELEAENGRPAEGRD